MYGMGARRGGKTVTKALLEKVHSQLSGKIIQDDPPSDDKEDLNAYLRSLNKKKAAPSQPKWDKYDEASDLSVSEDEAFQSTNTAVHSTAASKYLKKKSQPTNEPQPKQNKGNDNRLTGSAITEKLTGYAAKYGSQTEARMSTILSDSDLDINLSMDEEVLTDVQSWKKKPAAKETQNCPHESDDSSRMSIGHGGRRFLKKKPSQGEQNEKSVNNYSRKGKSSPLGSRRHYSNAHSDIDDITLSESYGSKSHVSSTHSPTPPKNKPKRKTNNKKRSVTSDDQSVEESERSLSVHGRVIMAFSGDSGSDDDDINFNVMELGDLAPVTDVQPSKEKIMKKAKNQNNDTSDGEDDVFNLLNLQTVDELLGAANELSMVSEVKTEGGASEVQTEPYESDFEPTSTSGKAPTPLKSILATPRSPKTTPRSARGRVRYLLDEDVKIRSRSPSPEVISTARGSEASSITHTHRSSEATEISSVQSVTEQVDGSGSETYTEDYSEDFSSSHSVTEKSSASRQRKHSSDVYSDDFLSGTDFDERTKTSHSYSRHTSRESFTDDYTSYTESSRSRTPSPDMRRKKSQKRRNRKVQTELDPGMLYQWQPQLSGSALLGPQYDMAFVDPTPIATRVVSAEALEAVTAYSPSVLALNDMLRQQLKLLRHFLETQRRLHDSYSRMVPPDYQYVTLAETKKYIKQHKRKTITFDEALTQVKAEMGLE